MIIGNTIYQEQFTENSLDWAKSCIDTAPDGAVFLAHQHGTTRGRQGRTWEQKSGQLLLTILLKPTEHLSNEIVLSHLATLNMAFALGLHESLCDYNVVIKWPNDFVRKGKKVGGMIMESVMQGDQVRAIIIGLGINLTTQFPSDDPLSTIATSLLPGGNIDSNILMQKIFTSCDHWYRIWFKQEFNLIFNAWREHNYYLGKKISAHLLDKQVIEGILSDLMPSGDAIIQDHTNKEHYIPFYTVDRIST